MSTSSEILQQYVKLTEFLGLFLGPDYEIALHDLSDANHSVIAIANNYISGRQVGAPLTNVALSILRDKSYETSDHLLHYRGTSVHGKSLLSSTMFIKHDGELIGMLCINFDDSRYRAVADQVMELCRPDILTNTMMSISGLTGSVPETAPVHTMTETFSHSADSVAADSIGRALEKIGVAPERLSSAERMQIIATLDAEGIFLLKGIVKDVAARLRCSQASVYRYLSQIRSGVELL